jgi:hypothetical protein
VGPRAAGRIDWEVWYLRTWPIPAWRDDMPVNKARCLSGLVNRASNAHIWSDRRTYVDIDGDGRFETAILWHCYTDDGRPEAEQVVVYRFAAGRPEIVSQVIATTGGVRQILELEGRTSGVLRVRVGSERLSTSYFAGEQQWRGFAWNGKHLVQVAGLTEFRPSGLHVNVALEASSIVFGEAYHGIRTGRMTLTVKNIGATPAEALRLIVDRRYPRAHPRGRRMAHL